MSLPITVYGATYCDDTQRVREYLRLLNVPFREINIDHDKEAEQFVIFINGGMRSTPTLVIGEGKSKMVIAEPTNAALDKLVAQAGHSINCRG